MRSTVFPSRFLIRQGKMEEATIKEKADDFIANGLKSLADGLEKRATGDRWILSQVLHCILYALYYLCFM